MTLRMAIGHLVLRRQKNSEEDNMNLKMAIGLLERQQNF